jgi:hypothetical protein
VTGRTAVAAAAAVVLACLGAGGARAGSLLPAARLQTSISPGPHLFGDAVRARLDVFVDRRRADPKTVRVDTKFFPYDRVGAPARTTATKGPIARISYTYTLDCLTIPCTPGLDKQVALITFPVAVARYRDLDGTPRGLAVKWPPFRVFSRLPPLTPEQRSLSTSQFRNPALALNASFGVPKASYRMSAGGLAALLFGAALLALGLAAVAGRPVLAHLRQTTHVFEAAPLTPLEQALERVEAAARGSDARGDREALARLARELRQAGMDELVLPARELAWSGSEPTAEESLALVQRVRTALRSEE